MLEVKWDKFSHTSDYFDLCLSLCEKLIKEGKAFADDTEPELMKQEREKKIESKRRNTRKFSNLSVEFWQCFAWCLLLHCRYYFVITIINLRSFLCVFVSIYSIHLYQVYCMFVTDWRCGNEWENYIYEREWSRIENYFRILICRKGATHRI